VREMFTCQLDWRGSCAVINPSTGRERFAATSGVGVRAQCPGPSERKRHDDRT
jgi:hypothetical protein